MSEEILKAITQLFAIITKQDGGVSERERDFVISFFKQELDLDSVEEYLALYDRIVKYEKSKVPVLAGDENEERKRKRKRTSVSDSVKTLAICRKINKTLTQKQKIVVLTKLFELIGSDRKFTENRMEIIHTVAEVFNVLPREFKMVSAFMLYQGGDIGPFENLLVASGKKKEGHALAHQFFDCSTELIFMCVPSVDMYFVRCLENGNLHLNGLAMQPGHAYLYSHGSTIKSPSGGSLYYSKLIRHFHTAQIQTPLSFNVEELSYQFSTGNVGLRDINISEGPGKLIGIMGGSGTGKTTLLNVLAGLEAPSEGRILINGIDINSENGREDIKGVVGYVSQDDLLIEELSVYDNLYYNAKLSMANLSEEQLHEKVMHVLTSLGLEHRKSLRVGNALDKTISGGQRKRLNIALELIREPSVLFVDEPTSGLSSRDSENVIDLLKELSLKGKLIFVVIHQPSSDIFKMFDKMFILDLGGYPIYYGDPVESVTYFKGQSNQVDAERGQCVSCGNVNPEQIFNIIEAKVVDEYGEFTSKRKVSPKQWYERFRDFFNMERVADVAEKPVSTLKLPSRLKQTIIFATRDIRSKLSNSQYMLINFLQAPLLAFILAFIIRYKNSDNLQNYLYRFNENIPIFIMMAVIVSMFIGLTVSAEEIIRDRKILKRESFLSLSWSSYLSSKLAILFCMSAIQSLSFVLIANLLLEIQGMYFTYWFVLFTVSCFANILGLNISSAFNSSVTVYIIIPFIIIPQMVLSGLLFPFDKLNEVISNREKVPLVADLMVTRWAFEAIAVDQFKENEYQRDFYKYEQALWQADFKSTFYIKELRNELNFVERTLGSEDEDRRKQAAEYLQVIRTELEREPFKKGLEKINIEKDLSLAAVSPNTIRTINSYLTNLKQHYLDQFRTANVKKDMLIQFKEKNSEEFNLNELKDHHYNESMADLMRNISVKERVLLYEGKLVQQIDPIFNEPYLPSNFLDYRAHFFAPKKAFLGRLWETYGFNLCVIWFMTVVLFFVLYFEILKKLVTKNFLSVFKSKK
ncbi:MAG: ATP-binding cassette domain-containing protein [Cytophagales bacterium]|nr:ATP-binding cassette domain-containing protein [Cytophagales bacterium]